MKLKRGSPAYPNERATVIVALPETGAGIELDLTGPGISGRASLLLPGVEAELIDCLIAVNSVAPLGIDLFFVRSDGQVAALPRSTSISIASPPARR